MPDEPVKEEQEQPQDEPIQDDLFEDEDDNDLRLLEELEKQYAEEDPEEEPSPPQADPGEEQRQALLEENRQMKKQILEDQQNWGGLIAELKKHGQSDKEAIQNMTLAAQQNPMGPTMVDRDLQQVPYVQQPLQPNPEIQELREEINQLKNLRAQGQQDSSINAALEKVGLGEDEFAKTYVQSKLSAGEQDIPKIARAVKSYQKQVVRRALAAYKEELQSREDDSVESSPGVGVLAAPEEKLEEPRPDTYSSRDAVTALERTMLTRR